MLHKTLAIVALAALIALLPGCDRPTPEDTNAASSERPQVLCTIGMVTDIARAVAGDRADVSGLLRAGIDPHLYSPTRDDIAALLAADIIFYNGLVLEGKMTDAFVRAATSGRKVHAVTELVPAEALLEPDGPEGYPDPHLWMDPTAWKLAVDVIRDALTEFDPEGADIYESNASAYQSELDALHEYTIASFNTIPTDARILITAHDAFNYLGNRYDFEVMGIQGLSTESEAGLQQIESLVGILADRSIPAVFAESTVNDRGVRALISGAAARGHEVSIGGELFSDAMGPEGTYEGTYLGMIDHNVTTITRALGGQAPERGRLGRLGSAE
ncbi:MAG: zinc ABC transporter substrate-binding protein [Planctomycetota bacterium]